MSLIVERDGRVLHIRLARSEKRNALDTRMCAGIVEAVQAAQVDAQTGCILISAAGPVFSAGMDLDEAIDPAGADLEAVHEALFTIALQSLKPIVVGVNGPALGGGVGLVAQAHIAIASEDASFGLTEIRLGLWPFLIYRSVEAALGARRALELSLSGRLFSARDALDWGLVHHICPRAEIAERAHALARDLAQASPEAIAAGMRYWRESRGVSFEEAGVGAARLRKELLAGRDWREGYAAFKEKRRPRWPSL